LFVKRLVAGEAVVELHAEEDALLAVEPLARARGGAGHTGATGFVAGFFTGASHAVQAVPRCSLQVPEAQTSSMVQNSPSLQSAPSAPHQWVAVPQKPLPPLFEAANPCAF